MTPYQKTPRLFLIPAIICAVILAAVSIAQANKDWRGAIVVQVPFGGVLSIFNKENIRLGASVQYADVESTSVSVHRIVEFGETTKETVTEDKGDQVYGLEGNFYIRPFGEWKPSFELIGFYGNNDFQGAGGYGYDWFEGELFITVKLMFPYGEIGTRFIGPFEMYFGVRSYGSFTPDEEVTVTESSGDATSPEPEPDPTESNEPDDQTSPFTATVVLVQQG